MLAETDRRGLHETGAATTHTPRGQSVAASGGSARMSSEADGVPSASFDGSAATHLNCSKAPARRNACIGASRLRVGHVDIVATPG